MSRKKSSPKSGAAELGVHAIRKARRRSMVAALRDGRRQRASVIPSKRRAANPAWKSQWINEY